MLIKTREFDEAFKKDSKQIAINQRPFREMGSYKVKKFGEPITDIDLTAIVHFDEKLLQIISRVIRRTTEGNKFLFIHMSCGTRIEFELPWTIDNNGGCQFNLEKAYSWYNSFSAQKLVPVQILEYIRKKLFRKYLSIRDLIDIEKVLHPYGEIIWLEQDIQKGSQTINGVVYNLLDIMKTETPVLEYIYRYNNEIVAIDVGLLDFKNRSSANWLYSYYTDDWYRILKTYRWKLKEKYKSEYFKVMAKITHLIIIKYQLELYKKLRKYHKALADNLLKDIQTNLRTAKLEYKKGMDLRIYKMINNYLSKYVNYFYERLDEKHKDELFIYNKRGFEGQIYSSTDLIKEREQRGATCPFFSTDINEYQQLVKLSSRIMIDVDTVVDCVVKTATNMNISIKNVISELGQNTLSLAEDGENIILYDRGVIVKKYTMDNKKILQTAVLVKRAMANFGFGKTCPSKLCPFYDSRQKLQPVLTAVASSGILNSLIALFEPDKIKSNNKLLIPETKDTLKTWLTERMRENKPAKIYLACSGGLGIEHDLLRLSYEEKNSDLNLELVIVDSEYSEKGTLSELAKEFTLNIAKMYPNVKVSIMFDIKDVEFIPGSALISIDADTADCKKFTKKNVDNASWSLVADHWNHVIRFFLNKKRIRRKGDWIYEEK